MDQRLDKSSVHMWFNSHTFVWFCRCCYTKLPAQAIPCSLAWVRPAEVRLLVSHWSAKIWFLLCASHNSEFSGHRNNIECLFIVWEIDVWAGAASCHIGCHLLCVREEQREISLLLFTQRAKRGDAGRGRGAQTVSTTFCALVGPECRTSWGD